MSLAREKRRELYKKIKLARVAIHHRNKEIGEYLKELKALELRERKRARNEETPSDEELAPPKKRAKPEHRRLPVPKFTEDQLDTLRDTDEPLEDLAKKWELPYEPLAFLSHDDSIKLVKETKRVLDLAESNSELTAGHSNDSSVEEEVAASNDESKSSSDSVSGSASNDESKSSYDSASSSASRSASSASSASGESSSSS